MQHLMFVKKGVLEWQDTDEPKLVGDVDALVRPIVVARCDLDLPILLGLAPFRGPFPFGHEFIAEVTAIGDEVTNVEVGQLVIVPFQISCGDCKRCHGGLSNSCQNVPPHSHYGLGRNSREWGGALAELVRVPYADGMLVGLPDGINPVHVASASDNLPDAWRTVGPYLTQNADQNVLIVGGGAASIGLYATAMATALGAAQVDYIDIDPERLKLAEAVGANAIEGPPPKSAGEYGITVDASADQEGLACALRSVEPGGICTSVGIYYQDTLVPLLDMYGKGMTFVTGRVNAREGIPHVLQLVKEERLHPELFNTLVADWEDAPQALMEQTTKVVVKR